MHWICSSWEMENIQNTTGYSQLSWIVLQWLFFFFFGIEDLKCPKEYEENLYESHWYPFVIDRK